MRKLAWRLFIIIAWASVTFGQTANPHSALLPNPKLTLGAVRTTDAKEICAKSFRTGPYRRTTSAMKKHVCAEYGVVDCPHQNKEELDHLVPLELGGLDVEANLWVQFAPQYKWKDHLENYLRNEVCLGKIKLTDAQHDIATDWVSAYEKYIGPLPTK